MAADYVSGTAEVSDPSYMDADACLAEITVGRPPSDRDFFAQLTLENMRNLVVFIRAG